MNQFSQSLKGQFLMAMPGLTDPNFYQTVTCLSEHNLNGAMGIIVSRIHPDLSASMIFEELNIQATAAAQSIPIFIGGPVHMNELFILHGPPLSWQGSLAITEELALSNSSDILESIAMGKGPQEFIISLGCAGWGPGQLESEIQANAWIHGPFSREIAFHTEVEQRWEAGMKAIGIDPALLSGTAGHA
jgi:putative transcriptional regulator